jgi:hypothetical protein
MSLHVKVFGCRPREGRHREFGSLSAHLPYALKLTAFVKVRSDSKKGYQRSGILLSASEG